MASPPAEACDGLRLLCGAIGSRRPWHGGRSFVRERHCSSSPPERILVKLGGDFVSRLQRKNSDEFLVWLAAFLHDPLELRAVLEFAEVFSFEKSPRQSS